MTDRSSVVPEDVARFAAVADEWWDPAGKFAPLHQLNPARLAVIRDACVEHFQLGLQGRSPFSGLRLLDVGCGGGLVCEPMTRMGFAVTGVDAAGPSLEVARSHAANLGLAIDYREATVEELVSRAEPGFDVVLALEIIEHVADPAGFLADCARLLAPGGLLMVATLNRTWRSLALAKVAAEYILRWVPAGAHDWRKFLAPEELSRLMEDAGLLAGPPIGLTFAPLAGRWSRSADTGINYILPATRAPS